MGGTARVERAVMPKVRMDTGLLRGKSPRRVVLEERIQQISCRTAEARNQRSRRPFPLRKGGFIVGKRSDIRPILFGGGTQGTSEPVVSLSSLPIEEEEFLPEDVKDFSNLRVAGEKRPTGAHLSENRPDRPHIDAGAVLAGSEEDFRRPIPKADDLQRRMFLMPSDHSYDVNAYLVSIRPQWNTKGSGQSKVPQLEIPLSVD